MERYFKLELKKAIFSWRTIVSILIIMALFIVPYLHEIKYSWPGLDGIDMFIRICQFSYIGYIGPVVVGLVYATSIIRDKESGVRNKVLEIVNIRIYLVVKLLVNMLINSIVFAMSYGIFIVYLLINFGINNGNKEAILAGGFTKTGAFIGLYDFSKVLYIIVILLVTVIAASAFSTFIIGITTASKAKITAYILPIFYVIFSGIVFEVLKLNNINNFNVIKLFNLVSNSGTSGFGVLFYSLILIVLGIGLMYKFEYKRDLY